MVNKNMVKEYKEPTRQRILQAAFCEIHKHGYQGMRVEQILASTGLAKGALYHHFENKQALGYAVVDELLHPYVSQSWGESLEETRDPISALQEALRKMSTRHSEKEISLGCPLNNLTQEMSGLDDGFHERLQRIYSDWTRAIAAALRRGQNHNTVRADINSDDVALFIVSSTQGVLGAAKCMQSSSVLKRLAATQSDYLETLRA